MSYPDYKLAEKSLKKRQTKRYYFSMWSALLVTLVLLALAGDSQINRYLIPLIMGVGAFVAIRAYDLYREARPDTGYHQRLEEEMTWLFGEGWRESTDTAAYAVAENRMKARQRERWLFLPHLLTFIPFNTVMVLSLMTMIQNGASPLLFFIPLGWLAIIIWHGLYAFPPAGWLAQRERKAGEALQQEMERLQTLPLKNGDKLKRDVLYTVGEDGELVELSEEEVAARRLGST